MNVTVQFSERWPNEATQPAPQTYGPYAGVQLLINELWVLDAGGEALYALAEYDTHEGDWYILGITPASRKYNLVTIRAAEETTP